MARGVARGDRERGGRHVEGEGARVPALVQQRDGDAARARAHVADERRVRALQNLQRGLDQQLRLGARDEHVRVHLEVEPVELLPPRDVLERLARGAAHDPRRIRATLLAVRRLVRVRDEKRRVAPQRVREQRARLAPRLRQPRDAQTRRGLAQRVRNRQTPFEAFTHFSQPHFQTPARGLRAEGWAIIRGN